MAWVRGIKEARMHQPERDGRNAIPKPYRVVVDLPSTCLGGTIRRGPYIFLPVHTGAGPCGTRARRAAPPSLMAWSIRHLVEPLQHYYATRPPETKPKLGAKHGGGNGQAAYL